MFFLTFSKNVCIYGRNTVIRVHKTKKNVTCCSGKCIGKTGEYANAPDIEVYLNSDPEQMMYDVWIPVVRKEA